MAYFYNQRKLTMMQCGGGRSPPSTSTHPIEGGAPHPPNRILARKEDGNVDPPPPLDQAPQEMGEAPPPASADRARLGKPVGSRSPLISCFCQPMLAATNCLSHTLVRHAQASPWHRRRSTCGGCRPLFKLRRERAEEDTLE